MFRVIPTLPVRVQVVTLDSSLLALGALPTPGEGRGQLSSLSVRFLAAPEPLLLGWNGIDWFPLGTRKFKTSDTLNASADSHCISLQTHFLSGSPFLPFCLAWLLLSIFLLSHDAVVQENSSRTPEIRQEGLPRLVDTEGGRRWLDELREWRGKHIHCDV